MQFFRSQLASRAFFIPPLLTALLVPVQAGNATGVVFHDKNVNGSLDEGEPPLEGIRVSDGEQIVTTDEQGRYTLSVDDDSIVFVIKPRGWRTPIGEDMLPKFYYIHKPAGSPPQRYPGVAPTGPLPASIDFPLYPQEEPDAFRAILFADPQPRNMEEIEYITHDVIDELVGADASFGVTLGDILFNDLSLFKALNQRVAMIGIPWYNVIGNHDLNFDAPEDKYSDETFESFYGPSYYSFDHGPVHFIVLDDVKWFIPEGEAKGKYVGGFGERQMAFIRNDLELVPQNQLIVLMMHIPLIDVEDRHDLYRLIEHRPFTLSISGHTHYQEHVFIGDNRGWKGPKRHHHVINVTVSGSWWSGAPDELGIPHTTMRDGAPNGYSIITFDGTKYSLEFRAARRPADYQMNIYAPEVIAAAQTGTTKVFVNVFAGSGRSKVTLHLDGAAEGVAMERVEIEDPQYMALKKMEEGEKPPAGRKLPAVVKSSHIWEATLPAGLAPGSHVIRVRTTDMFGQSYSADRVLIVK